MDHPVKAPVYVLLQVGDGDSLSPRARLDVHRVLYIQTTAGAGLECLPSLLFVDHLSFLKPAGLGPENRMMFCLKYKSSKLVHTNIFS